MNHSNHFNQKHAMGRNSMIGLEYGEHFVIWSIRRIITERGPDGLLLDECSAAFNEDGEAGLTVISVFLTLLGRSARRTFDIGAPTALFMTKDEHCILTLLAAAQAAGASGNRGLLDSHLLWLAKPAQRPELAQVVLALARLLYAHGHRIALALPPKPGEFCAIHGIDSAEAPLLVERVGLVAGDYRPAVIR